MYMNYQLIMEEELKKINGVPKLLMHACCAPCSSYCIEYLSNYFEITIFYYNPNIDTVEEYNHRLNEAIRFVSEFKTKYPVKVVSIGYNNNDFESKIKGLENEPEGGKRCFICYNLRLEETFKYAKLNNYDYVTTTLTISPLKKSNKINEIASILERKYNIKYLYSDFKKKEGYKRSIILSHEYNLYRQDYCGCIYSKNNKNNINL